MKRVLVINGHPDTHSYNHALARAYTNGLRKSNAQVAQVNIGELAFNPNLQYGYHQRTQLEPDLLQALEKIHQADHLVWIYPMWWYGCPAIMKGFIDRTFLPGIAFETVPGKALPRKLMKGKTAHIIVTADTPRWYDLLFMRSPAVNQFKKGTLEFCGISPVRVTYIAPIRNSSAAFRAKWLHKLQRMGEQVH